MSAVGKAKPQPKIRLVTETGVNGLFISNEQLARINPDLNKARRAVRLFLIDQREPKIHRGPTERPADVRIAGPDDFEAIYLLTLMDLEETGRVAPISHEDVHETLVQAMAPPNLIGVIDAPDGRIVAIEILLFQKWWWSKAVFIQKMVDFVHPEHRQSTHAAHLIQFGKWAVDYYTEKTGQRTYLLAGTLGTRRIEEKSRLYERYMTGAGVACLYPYPEPWE